MSGFGNSSPGAREWLPKLDYGLFALSVIVAPLLMGGRHPGGRLILIALIGVQSVVWTWRQAGRADARWVRTALLPLWLLAMGLLILQMTPLPTAWLAKLSPHIRENLPLWTEQSRGLGLGVWNTVSLTPVETRRGLALFVAYGLLFVVLLQRLRTWEDIRRLFYLMITAGGVMEVLALAQRFAGNGKFLWVYHHPFRDASRVVKGTFINENHLCGFLALIVPVVIYCWRFAKLTRHSNGFSPRVRHSPRVPWELTPRVCLILLGGMVATALLTFSRGGILAVGVASLAAVALTVWIGGIERRHLHALLAVGAVLTALLAVYGAAPLTRQWETLDVNIQEMSTARAALWQAVGAAIPDYLRCGAGVGAHRYVYPQHMPLQLDVELTHAENGYLQVLLETGVPGLLLLLAGWLIILKSAWRVARRGESPRKRGVGAVVLAAAAASLLHSMVDFVWYIPACMTLTLALAAVGIRAGQLVDEELAEELAEPERNALSNRRVARQLSPRQWRLGAVAMAGLTAWMVWTALPAALASPHWDQYLHLSLEAQKRPSTLRDRMLVETMVGHLQQAVEADPERARPQLRLASMRLKLFELLQEESENPMPLAQLREAANASRDAFGTFARQRAWLQKAVGDNLANAEAARRHALNTLRRCPLQGEAYILVAETEMLARLHDQRPALLQQALLLRPYSGSILFAVGSHFAVRGDLENAMRCYRAAFHRQPEVRRVLLSMLTPQIPAPELLAQLRPTRSMLPQVRSAYVQAEREQDAALVAEYIARFAEDAARKGESLAWKSAQEAWLWAGSDARAAMCGLRAVKVEPGSYDVHKRLGVCFFRLGKVDAALAHLSWCRQRNPQDEEVTRLHALTREKRLADEASGKWR